MFEIDLEKFEAKMLSLGWSKHRLCKEAGMGYETLEALLDGSRFQNSTAKKLADALGFDDPLDLCRRKNESAA